MHDRKISPVRFYHDYVQTYIERDLRQISLIHNLSLFQKFMGLCAGRTGQLLNYESLGNDTGISQTTVMEWLSILEASYIVFRLPPFYKNIGKRLVKRPKLYFYDTGLASYLMGIDDIRQIEKHPLVGNLFENLIISETLKFRMNRGMPSNICFFRDSNGNEVDLIIPSGDSYFTVEIKAGTTINQDFFKGFSRFDDVTGLSSKKILVYSGEQRYLRSGVNVSSFRKYTEILAKLEKQ